MYWMIEQSAMAELVAGRKSKFAPVAEEINAFNERASVSDSNPILEVVDGVANIQISGVLTPRPSFFAAVFGGGNTAYSNIIDAVSAAEGREDVKEIQLNVNSPGGSVDGMFDAMDIIAATEKTVTAKVSGMAASAAFGLASQADKIIAANDTTRFGSIGVVADFVVFDDEVSITSENAPNKRPDVKTEEGRAVVQEELNALEKAFTTRISNGRAAATDKELSVANVNSDFGRGGMLLAPEALKRDMIDGMVAKPVLSVVSKTNHTAKSGSETKGNENMNLEEFKAQHPALFAEVLALGVKSGNDDEKSRVNAHLILAETSGDYKYAAKCITEGTAATDQEVFAHHMSVKMNSQDLSNLAGDDDEAGDGGAGDGAGAGGAGGESALDVDKVFSQVENDLGIKLSA